MPITPNTQDVRQTYVYSSVAIQPIGGFEYDEYRRRLTQAEGEWNRWIEKIRQEARAEGWEAGHNDTVTHLYEKRPGIPINRYIKKQED